MTGLSRHSGTAIAEPDAHLAQSITDILSTPIGSRVMRRDYGSDLPRLIDSPLNGETQVDLFQATAEALAKWEPRVTLERVAITEAAEGYARLTLVVNGVELPVEVVSGPGGSA